MVRSVTARTACSIAGARTGRELISRGRLIALCPALGILVQPQPALPLMRIPAVAPHCQSRRSHGFDGRRPGLQPEGRSDVNPDQGMGAHGLERGYGAVRDALPCRDDSEGFLAEEEDSGPVGKSLLDFDSA